MKSIAKWMTRSDRRFAALGLACVMGMLSCMGSGGDSAAAQELPGLGPRGDLVRLEYEGVSSFPIVGRSARRQLLVTAAV